MYKFFFLFFFTFNSFAIDYQMTLVDKNLNQFVSWFSDITGKTVIIDKEIDSSISVFARSGVDAKDVYTLFINVLNSQGLSYRITNGVYRIYKTKFNLMPDHIKTEFYDFNNISGSQVDNLVSVLSKLSQQLIDNQYLQLPDNQIDSNKNLKFSIESLFSGRSLLVTAPNFIHDHLATLIPRLDTKLPQILVKAIIIETTSTDLHSLGVQLLGTTGNAQYGVNHSPSIDESLALLIDSVGFDAVIGIIDKTDDIKIKSMPQISVIHGATGSINVGQNVPFISGSTVSSGVNTGNPYQTIERQDVGLILSVIPHISNNNIVLQVSQELSSISSDIQASDIVTDKRSLSTTLNIQHGHSIVLGGLISDFKTSSVSGIPLLMDLPYIGKLFTNTNDLSTSKQLSIVLEVTQL